MPQTSEMVVNGFLYKSSWIINVLIIYFNTFYLNIIYQQIINILMFFGQQPGGEEHQQPKEDEGPSLY